MMKRIACLAVTIGLILTSATLAQAAAIPLDAISGNAYDPNGMISETEYKDDSIHVILEKHRYKRVTCTIAYVTIEHPSQLRTAMSSDNYNDHRYVRAYIMTRKVNSVAAINGDFFKYNTFGYTVRQGNVFRERPDGEHDVLLIDDLGEFTVLRAATMEDIQAYLDALPEGRMVVNSFNFGPLLVENGEVLPITIREYQPNTPHQRVAIVKISEKEYALVHCMGSVDKKDDGLTLADFADFIAQTIPQCKIAYNLDGGGSAQLYFMQRRMNANDSLREISDIVYFASSYQPSEE